MKYFGTDGIRGNADKVLSDDFVYKLANALAKEIKHDELKLNVLIGKDTRESGDRIEKKLIEGLTIAGVNVSVLGVTTTPHVSFELATCQEYSFGIMISASHNPFMDNGIKVFDQDGVKIKPEIETLMEGWIENFEEFKADKVGEVFEIQGRSSAYIEHIRNLVEVNESTKLIIDGANGSTYKLSEQIFGDKVGKFSMVGNVPNGMNINENVGSTHPETLVEAVKNSDANFGIAFDGDGDRIILVDEDGHVVDGDGIVYILGTHYKEQNKLVNNSVVITVMSNLGLLKALKNKGIDFEVTPVGDKYVAHEMIEKDIAIGGEQSGHIIVKEFSMTGDGLLVAALILEICAIEGKTLKQLLDGFEVLPQHLVNLKVNDKNKIMKSEDLASFIKNEEDKLEGNGRVLVRASGTEEVVRVMAEANDQETAEKLVDNICEYIRGM